ncbi:hypothetical protein SAMN05421833_12919, partial [Microbispora rosea]
GRTGRCRPRARGDGPRLDWSSVTSFTSPPRPRGWSPGGLRMPSGMSVAPAPAGMVLLGQPARVPVARRPRARGDGPRPKGKPGPSPKSPPRPRGWSRVGAAGLVGRDVAPAPAGMVRARRHPPTPGRGRPRARGDGPCSARSRRASAGSPPRPRGWSRPIPIRRDPRGVAPAPAGMVRAGSRLPRSATSRPRARGDGPVLEPGSGVGTLSPPRPRGWSGLPDHLRPVDVVAPAPAGMVPDRRGVGVAAVRRPRARGDGPRRSTRRPWPPRSPPRPRGWSHARSVVIVTREVAPAPAGMVP